MKRLSKVLAVLVAMIAPLAMSSGIAWAAATCPVGYTGPDTNNMCSSTMTYDCKVVNNTTVSIENENTQFSISGSSTSTGGTVGGSTSSGTATNSNGTVFSVTVKNDVNNLQTCSAIATIKAIPTPTSQVTKKSTVSTSKPAPAPVSSVVTLPNTSSDPGVMTYVTGSVVTLGVLAVVSRLILAAYSSMTR